MYFLQLELIQQDVRSIEMLRVRLVYEILLHQNHQVHQVHRVHHHHHHLLLLLDEVVLLDEVALLDEVLLDEVALLDEVLLLEVEETIVEMEPFKDQMTK